MKSLQWSIMEALSFKDTMVGDASFPPGAEKPPRPSSVPPHRLVALLYHPVPSLPSETTNQRVKERRYSIHYLCLGSEQFLYNCIAFVGDDEMLLIGAGISGGDSLQKGSH